MAAAQILSPRTTGGTVAVTVAANASVTVGIYSDTPGKFPDSLYATVTVSTPGAENVLAQLSDGVRQAQVLGPVTVNVVLPAYTGTAFGVFSDVG